MFLGRAYGGSEVLLLQESYPLIFLSLPPPNCLFPTFTVPFLSVIHEIMLLAIVVPLDRLLWRSGHFDRREEARQAIGDGRVRLNGQSCTRNEAIDPAISCITIDSAPLSPFPPTTVLAMHKPRGVLTTCSTIENEPTVVDVLGELHSPGVAPVGRLDQDTEGLLLLTNDGTLTKLLLERGACSKTYIARVVPRRPASSERRDDAWLRSMESGVPLRNGYIARASRCALLDAKGAAQLGCEVFDSLLDEAFGGDSSSLLVELEMRQGGKREVCRLCPCSECDLILILIDMSIRNKL